MKIFLKYNVPYLFEKTQVSVSATIRHGLVKDIFFDWEKSIYNFSLSSPYPVLNTKYGFIFYNFYFSLLLKEVLKDPEQDRLANNKNLLNILTDYFILLEIFNQLKKTAFYYDDKYLYNASCQFSRNSTFHETQLQKIAGIIESRGNKGLKELLTLKDVFFLYDLLMDYLKEKEQEGGLFNKINAALFDHYYKSITIFMCNFYDKGFITNKTFIPSTIPEYRKKLLYDLDMYLGKMKDDLENFSKSSYDSLFEHFELPEEPVFSIEKNDMFLYGKINSISDNHIGITHIHDYFQKRKKSFINLHHETLDYIFSLFHFELKEKFYI